jgi:hypothetical protein
MTEFKEMTEKEACIYTETQNGTSKKDAKKICAKCDNKIKKRFAISSYGIIEAEDLQKFKPELTVSATQENIRFVGKGYDIEKMFIEDQIKLGDSREHAEKLAQNILAFMETKDVKDKDDNISIESTIYYTHDLSGKREFFEIEKPKPKQESAYDRCVASRIQFGDDQKTAEEYSKLIMYDSKPTETTLKLRKAFLNKADLISTTSLMAQWQLERSKIEVAQIKHEIELNKSGSRLTVGDLYKPATASKNPFKKFNEEHLVGKGEKGFPVHNRLTVSKTSSFGKTRKQIVEELKGK